MPTFAVNAKFSGQPGEIWAATTASTSSYAMVGLACDPEAGQWMVTGGPVGAFALDGPQGPWSPFTISSDSSRQYHRAYRGSFRWIALSTTGYIAYTSSGSSPLSIPMTERLIATGAQLVSVIHANGYWVTISSDGRLWYRNSVSPDGTWTQASDPGAGSPRAIAWANGTWVITDEGGVWHRTASSPDGTWTFKSLHAAYWIHDVKYAHGEWIAVGERAIGSDTIGVLGYATSVSGTWTFIEDPTATSYNTVAVGGSWWLAAGTAIEGGRVASRLSKTTTWSFAPHAYSVAAISHGTALGKSPNISTASVFAATTSSTQLITYQATSPTEPFPLRTADAIIRGFGSGGITLDAEITLAFPSNAVIKAQSLVSVSADAWLVATTADSISADADIQFGLSANADLVVGDRHFDTITAEAVIRRRFNPSSGTWYYTYSDQVFQAQNWGHSAAYGDGVWAFLDINNNVRYASDLNGPWNNIDVTAPAPWNNANVWYTIRYRNGYWFLVGEYSGGKLALYRSSLAASGWSVILGVGITGGWLEDIEYGDGYWVAVGNEGHVQYTTDLSLAWTRRAVPEVSHLTTIIYVDGVWFTTGSSPAYAFYTSDITDWDGWTSHAFDENWLNYWIYGYYGGGRFIVSSGTNGMLVAESPGGPWTEQPTPPWGAIYGEGWWLGPGGDKVWHTQDPLLGFTDDVVAPEGSFLSPHAVVYGGDHWVAAGSGYVDFGPTTSFIIYAMPLLISEGNGSVTADAEITLTQQIKTAAVIQATGLASVTADAILQLWFPARAVIFGTRTQSLSANAIVRAFIPPDRPTLPARNRHDRLETHLGAGEANNVVLSATLGSFPAGTSVMAVLEALYRKTLTLEAQAMRKIVMDAITQATVSGALTADALASLLISGSFSADAMYSLLTEDSVTAEGILLSINSLAFTADATLMATMSNAWTADAELVADFTADAITQATQTFTFTANAVHLATIAATFTADAVVTPTFTADAVIEGGGESGLLGDHTLGQHELGGS